MAHGLRYYKELTHADGKVVRLELLQKDYAGASMEIGPVCQSLRLDIQGDTEIDAPIVKTSLSMTFVDAPDHVDAKTKKCGNWAEFYTNDATYWQVVVKAKNAGETAFRNVWGGYVTPDSYNEVLVYRGSVTIVARDNIGHMQDFPFDAVGNADGMISFLDLVYEAWEKIDSPMLLNTQAVAEADWLLSNGHYAYDTMMNVSAFEGMDWYEVLESVLYAYGVVMRYTGDNSVCFYPLRNMPKMGTDSTQTVSVIEPVFMTGAERELVPSVRRIEESIEFDIVDNVPMPQLTDSDFTGTSGEYTCEIEGVEIDGQKFGTTEHQAPVWPISNKTGKNWANPSESTTLFFRPAYDIGYFSTSYEEEIRRYMYIAANNKDERVVKFRKNIQCADMCITIKFGTPIGLNRNTQIERAVPVNLFKITYAVTLEQNGITEYYKGYGNWVVDAYQHTVEYDATQPTDKFTTAIEMGDHAGDALLTLHIYKIEYKQTSLMNLIRTGLYACIQSLTFDVPQSSAIVTKNSVNTNYDAKNNVILSRDVKIAPAMNTVSIPSAIRNGIFTQSGDSYIPAKLWYWGGGTSQQMAVYNHLQLLCYHAKPNSVIRGTIVNADLAKMSVIYSWQGLEMMLVSGSLNFISGYLENAVLREFARYEDMWGTLDETELPAVEGGTATTADGGGSGSGNSASVTNVTEVYIGGEGGTITLDTYMSDSSENGVQNKVIKAYVDGEVKEVADLLTSMWRIEDNKIVTDMDVLIKANLIIEGDTSSGGEGEDTPASGIRGIYVNGTPYTDEDGDGFIDLGTISGGGGTADLSNYYTKAQSDAKYLALNGGGTISGATSSPLSIGTSASSIGIPLLVSNSEKAWFGWSAGRGTYLWNATANKYIGIKEDGTPYFESNTLIHSGNIGSQTVERARYIETLNYAGNAWYADQYKMFAQWTGNTIVDWMVTDGSYEVRVDMAKKLAHSNGTVGAVVNSSGNVGIGTPSPADKLHVDGRIRMRSVMLSHVSDDFETSGSYLLQYYTPSNKLLALTSRSGSDAAYKNYIFTSDWSNGHIGLRNVPSPDYSVYVTGSLGITGAVTMSSTLTVGDATSTSTISGTYVTINTTTSGGWERAIRFQQNGSDKFCLGAYGTGSVMYYGYIGTSYTAPWVKFTPTQMTVNGDAIITGDTSSGSDIRFKDIIKNKTIKIEHIAKAPLFTFRWNDRDDNTIHLGSSAQYWEKVCPWLVTGEDFKSLNYATLGVAMGISLAKKAVNHEARIKELEKEIKRLKEEMR